MIGIGITTCNRPDLIKGCIENIQKFTTEPYKIFVVDDASEIPFNMDSVKSMRFHERQGTGISKNACLEHLDDCEHIFLFDDDCWPIKTGWEKLYIEASKTSNCLHFGYTWDTFTNGRKDYYHRIYDVVEKKKVILKIEGMPDQYVDDIMCDTQVRIMKVRMGLSACHPHRFETNNVSHAIKAHVNPCGVMLYFDKKCLEVVGGFNPEYGLNRGAHVGLSYRIHNKGFTPAGPFLDVVGSDEYFYALDREQNSDHKGIIPPDVTRTGEKIVEKEKTSTEYIKYSTRDWFKPLIESVVDESVVDTSIFVADTEKDHCTDLDKSVYVNIDSFLNIGVNNFFDNIYCLNLDRRPEKWNKIKDKFEEFGMKVQRFSAIDGDNIPQKILRKYSINKYAVGCLLSHYEIIKDAKNKGYKKILIFEDDVNFTEDFIFKLEYSINVIKNWKLLYLGCSQYNWDVEYTNSGYLSKESLGTFAYAIQEDVYDDILETKSNKSLPIDNLLSKVQEKYYGQCYSIFPNLCIPDVTISDIRESRDQILHSSRMKWNVTKCINERPYFSIIIPTFNSRFLKDTLESVKNQTFVDYECIVINDNPTEDLSIYENEKIKIFNRMSYFPSNGNVCRNIGIRKSRGKFLIFLDSGDILSHNCLQRRYEVITEESDMHIFNMGRFKERVGDLNTKCNRKSKNLLDDFLSYKIPWPITSCTWKRQFILDLKGFDQKLYRFQDFEIHIRALLRNPKLCLYPHEEIDSYYRNSQFHCTMTEEKKKIILNSAHRMIDNFKKHEIEFNDSFYTYLKQYEY